MESTTQPPVQAPGTSLAKDRDIIYTLRSIHQHQTSLLALADQKANILLGIVAIVFSVLSTRIELFTQVDGWLRLPLAAFLLTELAALVLSLLVIMPRTVGSLSEKELVKMPNPFFFGFFTQFPEDDYLDHIATTVNDNHAARHYLAKNIYQVGQTLRKKYAVLKAAYLCAAAGVACLLVFILQLLLHHPA